MEGRGRDPGQRLALKLAAAEPPSTKIKIYTI